MVSESFGVERHDLRADALGLPYTEFRQPHRYADSDPEIQLKNMNKNHERALGDASGVPGASAGGDRP